MGRGGVGNVAAAAAIHRKRKQQLARERHLVQLESKRRVDAWFVAFDKNQSGVLERDQIKELLQYLSPDRTPDEKFIDLLMTQAVAIDTTGDGQNDTKGECANAG
jgi:Ca2+-binding EF-hand superfamily protein